MNKPAIAVCALSLLAVSAGSHAVVPKADYQLQGVLTSTVGSPPPLTNLGPGANAFSATTVDGVSRQVLGFPLHNGVQLTPTTGVVAPGTYTISILVALDAITGNRRLADFKNGTADTGLYENSGKLAFVTLTAGTAPVPIVAGSYHQYVLTRDDATAKLIGYVDGLAAFTVNDPSGLGMFDAAATMRLFRDNDTGGTTGEDSAGHVARVRLYNSALDGEGVAALDWLPTSPRHANTKDFAFIPKSPLPQLGGKVEWDFRGPANHTATDTTGMGLYDSGSHAKGTTFTQTFSAAGIYSFHCNIHPSMTGTVKVPMTVAPKTGNTTTSFTLRWAKVKAPAGFVYDVQAKRPSDSSFVDFLIGVTRATQGFTPDAGAGTYQFQARMRKTSGGSAAYSVPLVIKVKP
jgi:plastocyanin